MKTYQIGPDVPYDLDCIGTEGRQWLVHWYEHETGGYDGYGFAAALRDDGLIEWANLGHCSCYGPTDGWPKEGKTVEEFISANTSNHALDHSTGVDMVVAKVKELLGLK